jgi:selenocysteine lyase/cysteine desulfurase
MSSSFSADYVEEIRKNFPRIERDFNGTRRIFLDNGAGSLVLGAAAEAEFRSRIDYSANTDALYQESKSNEMEILKGRRAVSDLINSPDWHNIFQGESASELFFRVAYSLRDYFGKEGNVVSTYAEHFANVAPYLELKKNRKISELRLARIRKEDGLIDMSDLSSLVNRKTRLIAITAESNLLGNKTDLKNISRLARENGALFLVDGVHFAPQANVDIGEIDCDFFVFSSYKMFGPRGSFMYVGERALNNLKPFYVDRNAKQGEGSFLEPGTRDQAIFSAITAVVDYISRLSLDIQRFRVGTFPRKRREGVKKGMRRVEEYQESLSRYVLEGIDGVEGLAHIKNVNLYGISEMSRVKERGSTFSFNLRNMSDKKAEKIFWEKFKITVVGGSHWNLSHDYYSNPSMLRVTFLHYNSYEEVKKFLKAVNWISKI